MDKARRDRLRRGLQETENDRRSDEEPSYHDVLTGELLDALDAAEQRADALEKRLGEALSAIRYECSLHDHICDCDICAWLAAQEGE